MMRKGLSVQDVVVCGGEVQLGPEMSWTSIPHVVGLSSGGGRRRGSDEGYSPLCRVPGVRFALVLVRRCLVGVC